ncbi:MAG: flagellin, partial [Pseudomonadota bacterium]
ESTITNLSNVVVNLEASRGRITDADFAAETAKLTRAQILQQAGISVASQANAAPQSVLGLLQ